MFSRRTLLKWIGAVGAGIAGEIISPQGFISIPSEAFVMPAKSRPMSQYDCLLNAELMKLDEREFHEAFVIPGVKQIGSSFFQPAQPMRFIDSSEVELRESQRRIVFPKGGVYVLERKHTPLYGHQASLFAMVEDITV